MTVLELIQRTIFIHVNILGNENVVNSILHRSIQIKLICRSYRSIGWCFLRFPVNPTVNHRISYLYRLRIRRTLKSPTQIAGEPPLSFYIAKHNQSRLMTGHFTDMIEMHTKEIKFLFPKPYPSTSPKNKPPALRIQPKKAYPVSPTTSNFPSPII